MPSTNLLPSHPIKSSAIYSLGLDINRKGKDSTAFVILEGNPADENKGKLYTTYIETSNTQSLTNVIGRVLYLHSLFNFKKIIIDTTGLGAGVTDSLKEKIKGDIVEDFIFTRKSKPELFNNLKLQMQQGRIRFPNYLNNPDERCKKLFYELLSIQQYFSGDSDTPQIYHDEKSHDDIVAALALAAWAFKNNLYAKRTYDLAFSNRVVEQS